MLGGLLSGAAAGRVLADAPLRSVVPLPRGVYRVQAPGGAMPAAEALIEAAQLGGQAAFALADAHSGQMLESHRPTAGMPPASVAKAITALYGLDALGPGFRFRTRLIARGALSNGRLDGDLILTGTGDPYLDTDDLAEMAGRLRAAGVREVRGRFLVHGGALPLIHEIDPAQPEHVGYNPSVAGLNLNFNRVYFEWKRGAAGFDVSMDARSETLRPAVSMARMRVAERQSPLYTYADRNGIEEWTVAAPALGNGGSRWLPVRRPLEYTGEVLRVLARSHGIELRPPEISTEVPRGTPLVELVSDPLSDMLVDMLKWSTNLTAEVVGLSASGARGGMPGTLAASGRRMGDWLKARAGVEGARFVDHSGLGDGSRISAQDMVRALVHSGPDGALRRMLKRIEMQDENGRAIPNHPARVVAKTGTLNFVSALAGYVQTPSNRVLAFAIFLADQPRRSRLRPDEIERPPGGRRWTLSARRLEQRLIERWATVHGG